MGKIAIITCSTSGLDYIEGYEDIYSARTTIVAEGKEYVDGLTMKPTEFYEALDTYQDIPTTAQPSPGQLLDIYNEIKEKGYDEAIYISISDKLSGTYQGVCLSTSYVEGLTVHPFNSESASYITGYMAMEAHRMATEGFDAPTILAHLDKIRENDHVFFMVDNLQYMVKNGRLSNASAFMANMLKIKPMLEILDNGTIAATEKIRTSKKAVNRIVDRFLEETDNGKNTRFTFLFNTEAPTHEATIRQKLEAAGFDTSQMISHPISPGVGCHIGKGVIGIGYVKDFD